MKDLLIQTLSALGYDVILQGSLAENEPYPESFITFTTISSPETVHLDDNPHGTQWQYSVIFYTSNPALMSTVPIQIYNAMRGAGFVPQGKGFDIPSDEPTHTGWANEYYYLDIERSK